MKPKQHKTMVRIVCLVIAGLMVASLAASAVLAFI